MAFRYRKSVDGDSISPVKDYNLDATYAATAKKGDVVRLNGSSEVVLAATGDANVLGVVEGFVFEGIGEVFTTVQVRITGNAIYEADVTGGTPVLGTAYGINGASTVDVADTAVPIVKVVEIVNGKPYVQITARQLA